MRKSTIENNGGRYLLTVHKLTKHFGGLTAVDDLDFNVSQGEILGLIGPNGAGKTTVLNMIGGALLPSKGDVIFQGLDISKFPPYKKAKKRITRVFQRNVLFRSSTVLENVLAAFHLHSKKNFSELFYKSVVTKKREADEYKKAMEILSFFRLLRFADELSVSLPHGSQRALCLAIAVATEPKLLLLDEPLTGMNASETEDIMDMIKELRDDRGITCIIVEHNMKAVMGLCNRVVVLDYGKKIAVGTPKEVVEKQEVIEAYLGME